MFSPALGRAVRSTSCISTPSVCALSRPATLSAAQQPFRPTHQRRLSSSKTSIPPGGSNPSETGSAQQSKQTSERDSNNSGKKASSRSGKKRARATSVTKALNVPYVNPTDHVELKEIKLTTFFSMHRPISPSAKQSIPHETSNASFDSIFQVQASNGPNTMTDTIRTLSGGIDSLESALRVYEQKQALEEPMQAEPEIFHLDGPPTDQMIDQVLKRWAPFTPPPVPVPLDQQAVDSETLLDPKSEETPATPSVKLRTWSTEVVVTESTDAAGMRTYSASTTAPMVEIGVPSAKNGQQMEETTIRQKQRQYRRNRMLAISVKRQRKLKMKKHKYKKLMKRTRLLRRKLDRT